MLGRPKLYKIGPGYKHFTCDTRKRKVWFQVCLLIKQPKIAQIVIGGASH